MFSLLAIGTIWFYLLLIISSIIIISFLETDSGGWATFTMAITFLLLYIFGAKEILLNFFTYIKTYPERGIGLILLYFILGTLYSFAKWYFYLLDAKERGVLKEHYSVRFTENKGRIISWMSYWPLSLVWTFIDQPVKRLFTYIYNRTGKIYQQIYLSVYKEDPKP